jgi:hypothetical protein
MAEAFLIAMRIIRDLYTVKTAIYCKTSTD